jgi:hypothetical protein
MLLIGTAENRTVSSKLAASDLLKNVSCPVKD